jgi:hypothetical protein
MSEEPREVKVLVALVALLRALNDNQAHGREDATVVIGPAELQAAGMVRDSPLYDKVMQRAHEERFLVMRRERPLLRRLARQPAASSPTSSPTTRWRCCAGRTRWAYRSGRC